MCYGFRKLRQMKTATRDMMRLHPGQATLHAERPFKQCSVLWLATPFLFQGSMLIDSWDFKRSPVMFGSL
jgi:hypothetical protein